VARFPQALDGKRRGCLPVAILVPNSIGPVSFSRQLQVDEESAMFDEFRGTAANGDNRDTASIPTARNGPIGIA
jgi:hypothetical protein